MLLEELAKLLRIQVEPHTPIRRLCKGSQKVRQCRKVFLEIRCCSHMVGSERTPKLLGVLDAWRIVLPCKISGRCEESSSERCCNLGGNAEVCHWVGCCSQDYVSRLPRFLSVLLGKAGQEVNWVVKQPETPALRLAAGFLVCLPNEHEAGGGGPSTRRGPQVLARHCAGLSSPACSLPWRRPSPLQDSALAPCPPAWQRRRRLLQPRRLDLRSSPGPLPAPTQRDRGRPPRECVRA